MEKAEVDQLILKNVDVDTISDVSGLSKSTIYLRRKVLLGREKRLRQIIARRLITEDVAIRVVVKACGVGKSWAYQVRKRLNHD